MSNGQNRGCGLAGHRLWCHVATSILIWHSDGCIKKDPELSHSRFTGLSVTYPPGQPHIPWPFPFYPPPKYLQPRRRGPGGGCGPGTLSMRDRGRGWVSIGYDRPWSFPGWPYLNHRYVVTSCQAEQESDFPGPWPLLEV